MEVKLISITPNAEKTIAYCARVSSPHQDKEEIAGLLKYCIKNQHWSIFEMANAVIEISTSRAIAQQILRHRSFSFQEFSQRYSEVKEGAFEVYEARRQDTKNRQNSINDMSKEDKEWFDESQRFVALNCERLYNQALKKGIAKEQARFLLPLSTKTKLYMNGTIRSWITYVNLRSGNGTQKEHMDIAVAIKEILKQELPEISKALEW